MRLLLQAQVLKYYFKISNKVITFVLKFLNVNPVLKEYIPEKIFPKQIPVTSEELIVFLK